MAMEDAKDAARQALIPQIVGGTNEIAPTAGAAQVQAMVLARFGMAFKQPRNMDQVRQDLLKECSRPSFALEEVEGEGNSALYRRPVGGGKSAEGLGIRFAEVAERCMGNLMSGALTISEDDKKKTKYCFVLDLQTNNSWEDTIDISKTVERREPKQGDEVLGSRINSTGATVYTIAASEDALVTKEAAMISKKLRTLILRLIPGDLQDECIATIKKIRSDRIMQDPDEAKKRIIDGMAKQNVSVTMLEQYLGHQVGQSTPAEVLNLQGLYGALRDGITTWAAIMEDVEEARKVKPKTTPGNGDQTATGDKGMDAAKAGASTSAPATPAAPAQTAAETPAQTVVSPTPPATAPAAQPAPPPVQPVTGADAPPAWTAQPPATEPATASVPPPAVAEPVGNLQQTYTPEPVTAPVAPVVQAPPVQPAAAAAMAPGIDPVPGGKGKIVKDVQFPARMTRSSEAEAVTSDQMARAESELGKLNQRLGKAFKLESTIKNWFQVDLAQLNTQTMECIITVLTNWK